jgi:hypothetical protein
MQINCIHRNNIVFCVVLLCVFTFWVPCCGVRYDKNDVRLFGSSLHPFVCRWLMSYLRYCFRMVVFLFCFSSSCVPYVASFSVFRRLVYPMLPVSLFFVVLCTLCCQFLCFSSSCVPYVASFSGLSILIAPSGFSNCYLRIFST